MTTITIFGCDACGEEIKGKNEVSSRYPLRGEPDNAPYVLNFCRGECLQTWKERHRTL